jgi:hypothetical protein
MTTQRAPLRAPRFYATILFLSWMLFQVTTFAHDHPDPMRFFFNLSARTMTVDSAARLSVLARWVRVKAAVDPRRLYYLYESYDSGMNMRGCRTYIAGALEAQGAALPFRVMVAQDPRAKCRRDAAVAIREPWRLTPDVVARIAPGDISLRRLVEPKDAVAFERYMKNTAPGEFSGMLRSTGAARFPRELTGGRTARCWIDINAYPDFVNAISFLVMIGSGMAVIYYLVRRRKCG